MRKIKSDVVIKKGENGWEAWQTNKLLYKTPGFDEESKEEVMKHIPGYENVIESSKQIKSAKSEEEFEDAIIEIADYFGVNAEGNNIPIGRQITDNDYMEAIDDICRRYNVGLRPSKNNSQTYTVINNSRQIKSVKQFRLVDTVGDEDEKEFSLEELKSYLKENSQYLDATGLDYVIYDMQTGGEMSPSEFEKRYVYSSRQNSKLLESRFYQNGGNQLYTLSEVAQYLSSLFFDLRTIHFLTTGSEFYIYHELAQELYEQTEDYYDDIVETAIGYDSNIQPMYVLPGDWNFVDEHGSLDTNGQVPQTLILERLEMVYDILEDVKEYDSMVASKLDAMKEYYDKEIYKLKQALK